MAYTRLVRSSLRNFIMLRLSKLTDYAVVVLVQLSRGAACQTAPGISRSTGVPEPTVAKVLKALSAAGIVTSQRGARGGYSLSVPAASIDVAAVVTAIDGPIALVACVEGSGQDCEVQGQCPVRGRWGVVNTAIRMALSAITLVDLDRSSPVRPNLDRPNLDRPNLDRGTRPAPRVALVAPQSSSLAE